MRKKLQAITLICQICNDRVVVRSLNGTNFLRADWKHTCTTKAWVLPLDTYKKMKGGDK